MEPEQLKAILKSAWLDCMQSCIDMSDGGNGISFDDWYRVKILKEKVNLKERLEHERLKSSVRVSS